MAAKDVEPVDRMTRWHDVAPIAFRIHDSQEEQRVIANPHSVKKPTMDLCDTDQLRGGPDRVTLAVSNLGPPSVCADNRRRGLTSCAAVAYGAQMPSAVDPQVLLRGIEQVNAAGAAVNGARINQVGGAGSVVPLSGMLRKLPWSAGLV